MAKALNAAAIMQGWANGMAGATKAYTDGVQGVTESPMAKAASAQATQDYINGCQASVTSGKRAAGLNRKSLEGWKQDCATTGAQRLASGAAKGKEKYQAWLNNGGLAAMQSARDAAAAVTGPKGADSTIQAKVMAAVNAMRAARKQ